MKIWFQNRRMKWRNSKERELIAHGGCREQTLPTKHNPNPDLSDPASPSPSQQAKQTSSDQPGSNITSHSPSQVQMPTLTSKPSSAAVPYLGLPQGPLIHPSQHSSLVAAASLPWASRASSITSSLSLALKNGSSLSSLSSPTDMRHPLDPARNDIGCESIDGEDDDDIDEDIEVDDVEESDDDDKDDEYDEKSEKQYTSTRRNDVDDNDNDSENDVQVG